jgi:hypothetical protein
MAQLRNVNYRSNEELARLLYQNPTSAKPTRTATPTQKPLQDPEPLASRRVSELGPQTWPLSDSKPDLGKLSDREERALFAALSKGSKANLGREPTVPEFIRLVERVNEARALVSSTEDALRRNDGIYIDDGRIIFSGPAQRRLLASETEAAA